MQVLKLTAENGEVTEIHMLNPGEHFPGFGGSRSGLVVGKTASMVIRRITQMGIRDSELDIHDLDAWTIIAHLINAHDSKVTAAVAERVVPA